MYKNSFSSFGRASEGLHCAGWAALVILFLLTGIAGHDPWKQDETYSFGIIYHFYTYHSWLVPINADQPFMEKPPLYYWTEVLLCKLLAGVLPLYDAARLGSVVYMIITCMAVWGTSQVLFEGYAERRVMGRMTLALLLGCIGLVRHAHDMFTDVALLAGTSVALLGLALLACRQAQWMCGAVVFGIGIGVAFLSKGLALLLVLILSGLLLVLFLPALRTRRIFAVALLALLVAFPFLFLWPYLLYRHSPSLFIEWFWNNNVGRFFGFSVDHLGAGNPPGYMLYTVLWFAFPAFPLACAALISRRHEWRSPEYLVPAAVSGVGFVLLLLSASARALYLLPLLPSFALLAVPALMRIPSHTLLWWNRGVRLLASVLAFIIIAIWVCALHPHWPQPFAFLYGSWLPLGFLPEGGQAMAFVGLLVFVLIWLVSFRLEARSYRDTALIWFCALAVLWGIGNCLLLPWVDETRSYRPVIESLNAFVSRPPYADECITRFNLGENVAPMWEYFGRKESIGPLGTFEDPRCPLHLIVTVKGLPPVFHPRWHMIWKGSRLLDDKDELQLYERNR